MDHKVVFVPRDAGFFSVFNFFIGMLSTGAKIYPFWNTSAIKSINALDTIQHFCYVDASKENSWFEYFKPIVFDEDDHIHTSLNMSNIYEYAISKGDISPSEFLIPKKEHFLKGDIGDWRQRIHECYCRYIRISDPVQNLAHMFVAECFPDEDTPVIAVHYRHPSHCCEEGFIPVSKYFEKVDELLQKHPSAHVFLATDTHFGVVAFKDKYGEKLIYNISITRTSLDNLLEWAYARGLGETDTVGFINNKGYELQHVVCADNTTSTKIGYDVLVDALCLSKCNWFVHTLSNVSFAVSYINPNIDMILL